MARFYADIQGSRGNATRMGTPNSGISGHIRGWDTGCRVEIHDDNGVDCVTVYRTSGSNNKQHGVVIAMYRSDDKRPCTTFTALEGRFGYCQCGHTAAEHEHQMQVAS